MDSPKRKISEAGPLCLIFLALAIIVLITGVLFAFCISVDRVVEFSNGWNNRNRWEPFHGGAIDYLKQLPHALYISFTYFTGASFISIVFFPLLIFIVPLYDMFFLHDYTFLFAFWLPVGMSFVFLALAAMFLRKNMQL